jgi:iron complex transport system permease protein
MKPIRRPKTDKRFFSTAWGMSALLGILLFVACLSLRLGSAKMTWQDFFGALLWRDSFETQSLILYSVRLPRVLGGALAGMGLAASGVVLQTLTDNPLASPNVIGVNAGAGCGVVLCLSLIPLGGTFRLSLIPLFAFIGALLTALTVTVIGERAGGTRASVVLAGVAVTAALNALISGATLMDADLLSSYHSFSIGGFSGISYSELPIPALMILLCLLLLFAFGARLDLLSLGTGMAHTMGVNVKLVRILGVLCAAALAASAVSFAGLLGFVGLIVPHLARKLVGNRFRPLLFSSVILGGTVCVLADLLGRILLAPTEIPVGIMMALSGGPFFLFLLFRERGNLK